MFRRILYFFLLAYSAWAAPVRIVGVVLDGATDRPIADVELLYKSGKTLVQSNSFGRFETEVESQNASLLVLKKGYDSLWVELSDYPDLLDLVFVLSAELRDLGQSTIVAGEAEIQWQSAHQVELSELEDAAGMRLDLAEHLTQMSGISGQKDFSSDLYYNGSRAKDVSYHLGRLRVPNMRHLDLGFPGNLSVINPRTLSQIETHDHYGAGPADQGLAASIQYQPQAPRDSFSASFSLGVTLQELVIESPFFIGNSFRFSFRRLDEAMLKNLGEKFFLEMKKSDPYSDEPIKTANPFNLSAFDITSTIYGLDSMGNNWSLNLLYSDDEYVIRQDTTNAMSEVNSIDIIKGTQSFFVLGFEYNAFLGTSFHLGYVRELDSDTLRDTTGFRTGLVGEEASFIDGYEMEKTKWSAGLEKQFSGHILGADLAFNLVIDRYGLERQFPDFSALQKSKLQAYVFNALSQMRWHSINRKTDLAIGAVTSLDGSSSPLASLDIEQKFFKNDQDYFRLFWGSAWRGDFEYRYIQKEIHPFIDKAASTKLGGAYVSKYLSIEPQTFARYYLNPKLPELQAHAHYSELNKANYAWVLGLQNKIEWKSSHHFSVLSNASSVYGEYELENKKSLPWESNARLDLLHHFRFYPRKDSLVSFILSHQAAWHRPLYYYKVKASRMESGEEVWGTREIKSYHLYSDLFRTDLRVNLDLPGQKSIFKQVRFYLEANNIFAHLKVKHFRFLGGENDRNRSLVTQKQDENSKYTYDLVPLMSKGMGLFIQFGVEGRFGI